MPWLMDQCDDELDKRQTSRAVLDDMIRDVVRTRSQLFTQLEESQQQQQQSSEEEEKGGTNDETLPLPADDDGDADKEVQSHFIMFDGAYSARLRLRVTGWVS